MKEMSARLGREEGFTLVEALVAISLLSIAIILTITPVLAGFDVLSDAKLATIASNLAQARVEELRSLDYEDIGFPLGLPEGILAATQTVAVQNVDFIVTTDVKYFGSVNAGEDVIPQGGDGVEGLADMGIDYKEVTVTVSHHAGAIRPVTMQTIKAPPNIAAHEGKSNVIVELIKVEPASKPASMGAYPQVVLVKDTAFYPFSGAPVESQSFPGVPANESGASDYYYYARLGPGLTDYLANGWRIHPIDIDIETDRVHMGPTETANVPLRIYRPAEIVIELFDDMTGLRIADNIDLTLEFDGSTYAFTELDPEWDLVGKRFEITELNGAPVIPGSYDMTATALGYSLETHADVVVPEDYPFDPVHEEAFSLEQSTDAFLVVEVVDDDSGSPISGASVTITPEFEAPFTLIADVDGFVDYSWAYDSFDVTIDVTSPNGHYPSSDFINNINGINARQVRLTAPPNTGVIEFHEDKPDYVQYFRYRPDGGAPDDWTDVYPVGSTGEVSVTVDAGRWDVQKVCVKVRRSNPRTVNDTITVGVGGAVTFSSSSDCPKP